MKGLCAEDTSEKLHISREDQDAYALDSYRKSKDAWDAKKLERETFSVSIPGKTENIMTDDEEYHNVKPERVPSLRPVFKDEGTNK